MSQLTSVLQLWRQACAVVVSFVVAAAAMEALQAAENRPNFLIILGDNLGKDWFGCYGADGGLTPNVDKLASTGVRFEHCYVTPLCSTTRAALWTGRYGFRTGWHTHHDAAIYGGGNFDWHRETTMARLLKSAGYATAIAGKWQINDLYEQPVALDQLGFDEHLVWTGALQGTGTAEQRWKASLSASREFESRYWNPIVFRNRKREEITGRFGPDVYVEFLLDFIERHRGRPFFAFCSTPLVHVPVVCVPDGPNDDTPERERFAATVRYLDQTVGRLMAGLERLGQRENTIVIFLTDNGTPARLGGTVGGKRVAGGLGTLVEAGLDVPLIVNCPGRVAEGRFSHALTDCTDVFATVAQLAGASLPPGLVIDGQSFAPQLDASQTPPPGREWIFSQYATTRVVRDHRFKLYSTGQLYDVAVDLQETTDLSKSQDAAIVSACARLQAVLDKLPPNVDLPFKPRSQSAFNLEAERKKGRQ